MRRAPTEAERALWRMLRAKRLAAWKFKRQQPLGRYIVDFVCFQARVIIEADGSQHADSGYDVVRDRWLADQGFRVLRFWNSDILARPDSVAAAIFDALSGGKTGIEPASPPTPLPDQRGLPKGPVVPPAQPVECRGHSTPIRQTPLPQGGREKKDQLRA